MLLGYFIAEAYIKHYGLKGLSALGTFFDIVILSGITGIVGGTTFGILKYKSFREHRGFFYVSPAITPAIFVPIYVHRF